jgi:hypothetical protein
MRRMSFAMTEAQLLDGSKTVTRRTGWGHIKPGDQVQAIDKLDFRRKGGSRVLGVITVVSVRRERIDAITDADVAREGFSGYTADRFIEMFCKAMRCSPGDLVTRIEFTFEPAPPAQLTLGGM